MGKGTFQCSNTKVILYSSIKRIVLGFNSIGKRALTFSLVSLLAILLAIITPIVGLNWKIEDTS